MKKKRIIPVILYSNGFVVQAKQFRQFQNIGNAADTIKRYSEWSADELIFLNIGENKNDIRRDDIKYKNKSKFLQIIKMISKNAFIPISVGGKIKNINDAKKII